MKNKFLLILAMCSLFIMACGGENKMESATSTPTVERNTLEVESQATIFDWSGQWKLTNTLLSSASFTSNCGDVEFTIDVDEDQLSIEQHTFYCFSRHPVDFVERVFEIHDGRTLMLDGFNVGTIFSDSIEISVYEYGREYFFRLDKNSGDRKGFTEGHRVRGSFERTEVSADFEPVF